MTYTFSLTREAFFDLIDRQYELIKRTPYEDLIDPNKLGEILREDCERWKLGLDSHS